MRSTWIDGIISLMVFCVAYPERNIAQDRNQTSIKQDGSKINRFMGLWKANTLCLSNMQLPRRLLRTNSSVLEEMIYGDNIQIRKS